MAVGQHVFVDSTGTPSGSVALGDASGKVLSGVYLADGVEVEVLAWRPRGASDTRYRVRAPNGADGWLAVEQLRKTLVRPPAPSPAPAPATPAASYGLTPARSAPVAGGGRRFGQHFETEHPRPVAAPKTPESAPNDSVGRRFGQHF